MNDAITVEVQFFLTSVLWGAAILFAYDGLRILRRIIVHNYFFIALEDLMFWVVSSVMIFAMMYRENNGIIRGFSIMGMGIGMVIYLYGFSNLIITAITKLIYFLLRPIQIVFRWLHRMVRYLGSKVKKICDFMMIRLKKIVKSIKIVMVQKKQKRTAQKNKKLEVRRGKKEKKKEKKEEKKIKKKQQKNKNNKNKTKKNKNMKKNKNELRENEKIR